MIFQDKVYFIIIISLCMIARSIEVKDSQDQVYRDYQQVLINAPNNLRSGTVHEINEHASLLATVPTSKPTRKPTSRPSIRPSNIPSILPTSYPTYEVTLASNKSTHTLYYTNSFPPSCLTTDSKGNLYFYLFPNKQIYKLDAITGTVTAFAGAFSNTGYSNYTLAGDNKPAINATFNDITSIKFDADDNMYIADKTCNIRRVSASTGIIDIFAGSNRLGLNCVFGQFCSYDQYCVLSLGSTALDSLLSPQAMGIDNNNNVYFYDFYRYILVKIDGVTTVPTIIMGVYGVQNDPVSYSEPRKFSSIFDIAVDGNGVLYALDAQAVTVYKIFQIDSGAYNSTIVAGGPNARDSSSDNILATNLLMTTTTNLAVDSSGSFLYIVSQNSVRRVDLQKNLMKILIGSGSSLSPTPSAISNVALDSNGYMFVCSSARIYKMDQSVFTFVSAYPSSIPTSPPSNTPSMQPSIDLTTSPTVPPSFRPSNTLTVSPTSSPTIAPSFTLSEVPTISPSIEPTLLPTMEPSTSPSDEPTSFPSVLPSFRPSSRLTESPTNSPSMNPSDSPATNPSNIPSAQFTSSPSSEISWQPSMNPSTNPTETPSLTPTSNPSNNPTAQPTNLPTVIPTAVMTEVPSSLPSSEPSTLPSLSPSFSPTSSLSQTPTQHPSQIPSVEPSVHPSFSPTAIPSPTPTSRPSVKPSSDITSSLTLISSVIVDESSITKSSFSVSVTLFWKYLQSSGRVYCLASTDLTTVISIGTIISDGISIPFATLENPLALVFQGLMSDRLYGMSCVVKTNDMITPSLSQRYNGTVLARTLCCNSVTFINVPSTIFGDIQIYSKIATTSHVFSYQLENLPVSDIRITPQLIGLSNATYDVAAFPSYQVFTPLSSIQGSFLVIGNAFSKGVYSILLNISGTDASSYRRVSSTFQVVPSKSSLPPPSSMTSFFSLDGASIYVIFNIETNTANIPISQIFPCPNVLSIINGNLFTCKWVNTSAIQVSFGLISPSIAYPVPGDMLNMTSTALQAKCYEGLTCSKNTNASFMQSIIQTSLSPIIPKVSLIAPSKISSCSNLSIDASLSYGAGGRRWKTAVWEVLDATKIHVVDIETYLNTIIGANIYQKILIPASYLTNSQSYTISLSLTNFLGYNSSSTVIIYRDDLPNTPIATVDGDIARFYNVYDTILVGVTASLPICVNTSSTLQYSKQIAENGIVKTDIDLTSNDRRYAKILPYQLTPGSTYVITISVTSVPYGSFPDATSSVSVSVTILRGKVHANIKGGTNRAISQNIPLFLDASASYDDESSRQLSYVWSCQIVTSTSYYGTSCNSLFLNNTNNDPLVLFNSVLMNYTDIYVVSVLVTSWDNRYDAYTTYLTATNSTITTEIIATKFQVNPNLDVTFNSIIKADFDVNVSWSVLQNDLSLILPSTTPQFQLFKKSETRKGISYPITFSKFTFQDGGTYVLRLVSYPLSDRSHLSSSQITITINTPPTSGMTIIEPSYGLASSTVFTISSRYWVGSIESYPFSYLFQYQLSPYLTKNLISTQKKLIPSINTIFPQGISTRDYVLLITGIVIDANEVWNAASTYVQVFPDEIILLKTFNDLSNTSTSSNQLAQSFQYGGERNDQLSLYDPQTLTSQLITATNLLQSSGDVDYTTTVITSIAITSSLIDCSLTNQSYCLSLNRLPCETTSHTCGPCYDDYVGVIGPHNSICYKNDSDGLINACNGTSCPYGTCQADSCIILSKSCPMSANETICSNHGVCGYFDPSMNRLEADKCLLTNTLCHVQCICETGYGGVDCSLSYDELKSRDILRGQLCVSIMTIYESQDPSSDLLLSLIATLSSTLQDEFLSDKSKNSCLEVFEAIIILIRGGYLPIINPIDTSNEVLDSLSELIAYDVLARNGTLVEGFLDTINYALSRLMTVGQTPIPLLSNYFKISLHRDRISQINNITISPPKSDEDIAYEAALPSLRMPEDIASLPSDITAEGYLTYSLSQVSLNPIPNATSIISILIKFSTYNYPLLNTVNSFRNTSSYYVTLPFSQDQDLTPFYLNGSSILSQFQSGLLEEVSNITIPQCEVLSQQSKTFVPCRTCNISSYTDSYATFICSDENSMKDYELSNSRRQLLHNDDGNEYSNHQYITTNLFGASLLNLYRTLSTRPQSFNTLTGRILLSITLGIIGLISMALILFKYWDLMDYLYIKYAKKRLLQMEDEDLTMIQSLDTKILNGILYKRRYYFGNESIRMRLRNMLRQQYSLVFWLLLRRFIISIFRWNPRSIWNRCMRCCYPSFSSDGSERDSNSLNDDDDDYELNKRVSSNISIHIKSTGSSRRSSYIHIDHTDNESPESREPQDSPRSREPRESPGSRESQNIIESPQIEIRKASTVPLSSVQDNFLSVKPFIYEAMIGDMLLSNISSMQLFLFVLTTKHEFIKPFIGHSLRETRLCRLMKVLFLILTSIFVTTVFYQTFYPNANECNRYVSKDQCLQEYNAATSTNKCIWIEDINNNQYCKIKSPPSDVSYLLLLSSLIVMCSIPIKLIGDYLIDHILCKRPDLESFGLSSGYWLASKISSNTFSESIKKNIDKNSSKELKLTQIKESRNVFTEYADVDEELENILSDVREFHETLTKNTPLMTRNSTSKIFAQATVLAIERDMILQQGSICLPLTWTQRILYGNHTGFLWKSVTNWRQDTDNAVEELKAFSHDEYDMKNMFLIQLFVLEQLPWYIRYALSKIYFKYDETSPMTVNPILWLCSWLIMIACICFFLYWIVAWVSVNAGNTLNIWGINFLIALLLDIFVVQMLQIYFLQVILIKVIRPQLRLIYRVLLNVSQRVVDNSVLQNLNLSYQMIQKSSIVCRISRRHHMKDLYMAKVFRLMTDADIEQCRMNQPISSSFTIFFFTLFCSGICTLFDSSMNVSLLNFSHYFADIAIYGGISGFIVLNQSIAAISPYLLIPFYFVLILGLVIQIYISKYCSNQLLAMKQARSMRNRTIRASVHSIDEDGDNSSLAPTRIFGSSNPTFSARLSSLSDGSRKTILPNTYLSVLMTWLYPRRYFIFKEAYDEQSMAWIQTWEGLNKEKLVSASSYDSSKTFYANPMPYKDSKAGQTSIDDSLTDSLAFPNNLDETMTQDKGSSDVNDDSYEPTSSGNYVFDYRKNPSQTLTDSMDKVIGQLNALEVPDDIKALVCYPNSPAYQYQQSWRVNVVEKCFKSLNEVLFESLTPSDEISLNRIIGQANQWDNSATFLALDQAPANQNIPLNPSKVVVYATSKKSIQRRHGALNRAIEPHLNQSIDSITRTNISELFSDERIIFVVHEAIQRMMVYLLAWHQDYYQSLHQKIQMNHEMSNIPTNQDILQPFGPQISKSNSEMTLEGMKVATQGHNLNYLLESYVITMNYIWKSFYPCGVPLTPMEQEEIYELFIYEVECRWNVFLRLNFFQFQEWFVNIINRIVNLREYEASQVQFIGEKNQKPSRRELRTKRPKYLNFHRPFETRNQSGPMLGSEAKLELGSGFRLSLKSNSQLILNRKSWARTGSAIESGTGSGLETRPRSALKYGFGFGSNPLIPNIEDYISLTRKSIKTFKIASQVEIVRSLDENVIFDFVDEIISFLQTIPTTNPIFEGDLANHLFTIPDLLLILDIFIDQMTERALPYQDEKELLLNFLTWINSNGSSSSLQDRPLVSLNEFFQFILSSYYRDKGNGFDDEEDENIKLFCNSFKQFFKHPKRGDGAIMTTKSSTENSPHNQRQDDAIINGMTKVGQNISRRIVSSSSASSITRYTSNDSSSMDEFSSHQIHRVDRNRQLSFQIRQSSNTSSDHTSDDGIIHEFQQIDVLDDHRIKIELRSGFKSENDYKEEMEQKEDNNSKLHSYG